MTLTGRLEAALAELAIGDGPIGVACSGGADSIALLHLCAALGRRVAVLHVDHGLREGSADDAAFVADRAAELGFDHHVERLASVVPHGASLEAVAREARYEALARLADEAGVAFVATAHTLDDQAETVLLRAIRGATLDAIAVSRGRFVRPMLGMRRRELRAWLRDGGISWRQDPTNDDVRFERNWIRHVVLPELRARRPGVESALARVAARSSADAAALDPIALEVFERARIDDIGVLVDETDLRLVPRAVASRVVRHALRHRGTDPSSDDVERVLAMGGDHLTVGNTDVWRIGSALAFIARPAAQPATVRLIGGRTVEDHARRLRIRVGRADAPAWRWRVAVAQDASLRVRARVPGDRVTTTAGTRKVSDVLIDAKIPRPLRDLVGVLASDDGALAVVGLGRSANGSASGTVVDVEPLNDHELGWARELLWNL